MSDNLRKATLGDEMRPNGARVHVELFPVLGDPDARMDIVTVHVPHSEPHSNLRISIGDKTAHFDPKSVLKAIRQCLGDEAE